MKKLLLIFLSITLFTACENEPLDLGFIDESENNNGNGTGDELNYFLSSFNAILDTTLPFFGQTITNATINYNQLGVPLITNTATTTIGITINTTSTVTVNSENYITEVNTTLDNDSSLSDVQTFTYDASNRLISSTYNNIESDDEDYSYTFTYNGFEITRTEQNTGAITIFMLNSENQLISQTTTQNGIETSSEIFQYNSEGNCISGTYSVDGTTITRGFVYDTYTNPLYIMNQSLYPNSTYPPIGILDNDLNSQLSTSLSISGSRNVIAQVINGTIYNHEVTYDSNNRILTNKIFISHKNVA